MENQEFNNIPVTNGPVNEGKGLSVAGLVLGIVAAVFAWWGWFSIIALLCGIAGIVLSVMGKKKAMASGAPTGMATAGLVLSIIGTVLAGIGFISCFICVSCANAAAKSTNTEELTKALNELSENLK